ncbi:unnamed protein product [Trichobilharzia regenti]|nr:unnamed protein product [Trichobilharzia regenti]
MIRRLRHPEIEVLTHATVRMREFLGLNHFPNRQLDVTSVPKMTPVGGKR